MTKQRLLIQEIIHAATEHLTAEDIYHAAKEKMPGIALGTVYRNLGLMVADGQIQEINLPGQPAHYDRIVPQHDHMICRGCGRISDVIFPELPEYLEKKSGEQVLSYELNVLCLCKLCRDKA